jgi:hypothetical protein
MRNGTPRALSYFRTKTHTEKCCTAHHKWAIDNYNNQLSDLSFFSGHLRPTAILVSLTAVARFDYCRFQISAHYACFGKRQDLAENGYAFPMKHVDKAAIALA